MDLNCLSRNQEQRWDYPGKVLGRSSVSWHESYEMHRRPTNFLIKGEILQLKKTTEMDEMEEGCWIPKTLQARRSLVKLLNCKYVFIKKKFRRMTLRVVLGPEIGATNYSGLCPDLETLCNSPC